MKRALVLVVAMLGMCTAYLHGQIPHTVSYQGVLTDGNGNPIPDGNVALTFRLFDAATSGAALWQETQQISVSRGVFSAILGSVTPLNLPFDKPYWLGITVAQGTELTPRVALTASPYSLNSHSTISEPAQGQGLTIRDAQGNPTHILSASGELFHKGKATFNASSLSEGDTALVILSRGAGIVIIDTDTGSTGGPRSDALKVSTPQEGPGNKALRRAQQEESVVRAFSNSRVAMNGESLSGVGVRGVSQSEHGVYGISTGSYGVEGYSETGIGVRGASQSGHGVVGISTNRAGVFGNGNPAGYFSGEVLVTTVNEDPTQERFLVWSEDQIVRYRTLPPGGAFDGVLQGKALVVKSATGTEVFRVDTNGTSEHAGLETFKAGLQTVLSNGNILRISPTEGLTLKTAAGVFRGHMDPNGNGFFAGTLTKGGGSFKIDHPLDPANKYLYHSFVESPDMKNVYDGVASLDENGEATVELPAYFEALNKEFRYQLTPIGAYAPLYVSQKIRANRFKIAGGTGGMEVSWQVTGVRKDAYAEKHRIPVEEVKTGEEVGHYLHPDAFGLPTGMGVSMLSESQGESGNKGTESSED